MMEESSKKYYRLLLGATIGAIIEFFMTITDQVIAGHMLSEQAIAGVGFAYAIDLMTDAFCAILSTGLVVRYVLYHDKDDKENASCIISTGLCIAVLGGLILGGAVWSYRANYAMMFGAVSTITSFTIEYLTFFALSAALQPVMVLLQELAWSDGSSKAALTSVCAQLIINVVASIMLVKPFGVGGIALGSALGYLSGILVLATERFRRRHEITAFSLKFSFGEFGKMVTNSIGDMIEPICAAVTSMVLNILTINMFGNELLPLTTLLVDVTALSMIFEGNSRAIEPFIGVYYENYQYSAIRSLMKKASLVSLITSCILMAIFIVCPILVVNLFGLENPELLDLAPRVLRLVAIGFSGIAFCNLLTYYYALIQRPIPAFILVVLGTLVMPIASSSLGALLFKYDGFVLGRSIASILALIFFFLIAYFMRGKTSFPLFLPKNDGEPFAENTEGQVSSEKGFNLSKSLIICGSALLFVFLMVINVSITSIKSQNTAKFSAQALIDELTELEKNGLTVQQLETIVHKRFIVEDTGFMFIIERPDNKIRVINSLYNNAEGTIYEFPEELDELLKHPREFRTCPVFAIKSLAAYVPLCGQDLFVTFDLADVYWERDRLLFWIGLVQLSLFCLFIYLLTKNKK